ncbi:hypothetical protein C3L55_08325 [Veillonellaceae bacterium M1-70]|nr:hypothetical protein [Veillonellaceae bacterium M1-70]
MLHSDICGVNSYLHLTALFAAYRVLHRLIGPRHPPYALTYLTFDSFLTEGSTSYFFLSKVR